MKTLIIATRRRAALASSLLLVLAGTSQTALAGGHFTCQATNSQETATVYIALDFTDINTVPDYDAFVFKLSTPIAPVSAEVVAKVFFWAMPETPNSFPVVAVLENVEPVNGRFKGQLTITDARAKPYGKVLNLDCKK